LQCGNIYLVHKSVRPLFMVTHTEGSSKKGTSSKIVIKTQEIHQYLQKKNVVNRGNIYLDGSLVLLRRVNIEISFPIL
jgi:hypothetical protein